MMSFFNYKMDSKKGYIERERFFTMRFYEGAYELSILCYCHYLYLSQNIPHLHLENEIL